MTDPIKIYNPNQLPKGELLMLSQEQYEKFTNHIGNSTVYRMKQRSKSGEYYTYYVKKEEEK